LWKNGRWKSAELASDNKSILLWEDDWLRQLYDEEICVFDDYIRYSARLKPLLKTLVQKLLLTGLSVVMDFPGNTKKQRAWFKEIFLEYDFPHQLHYIKASDGTCINQLKKRSENLPQGAKFTTEEEFHVVNSYFQPPTAEEGFNVQLHTREDPEQSN
jgi:hypothetical protein